MTNYLERAAGVWKSSSLALASLCRGMGIRYVHFLQPNQYDRGSKPMGQEEKTLALREGTPASRLVADGYPLLRAAARELQRQGVEFHDLGGVFSGVGDPLYIDPCCHVNERGDRLIAAAIAQRLGGR